MVNLGMVYYCFTNINAISWPCCQDSSLAGVPSCPHCPCPASESGLVISSHPSPIEVLIVVLFVGIEHLEDNQTRSKPLQSKSNNRNYWPVSYFMKFHPAPCHILRGKNCMPATECTKVYQGKPFLCHHGSVFALIAVKKNEMDTDWIPGL